MPQANGPPAKDHSDLADEHDGDDLRELPLIERKWRPRDCSAGPSNGARSNAHLRGSGASVLAHVCKLGLEGIVSKRTDAPYRGCRAA
jgi:bifunctional non-homologous end joining protein LigD